VRAAAILSLLLLSCQAETSRGPIALASLTPAFIPEGDLFSTPVLLDARASTDPDDASMSYSWRLRETDQYLIDSLDTPPPGCSDHLRAPCCVVRFRGERPVPVELTVTTENGSDTSTVMLGLTVD